MKKIFAAALAALLFSTGLLAQKDWSNELSNLQKQSKSRALLAQKALPKKPGNSLGNPWACLPDSTVSFVKDGNDSIVGTKTLFQYDSEGRRTQSETYSINPNSGELALSERLVTQFDAQGRIVLEQTFGLDQDDNFAQLTETHTFYNAASPALIDSVVVWEVPFGAAGLERFSKTDYAYAANETLAETIEHMYSNGIWEPTNKSSFEYDAEKKPIKIQSFQFDGTAWVIAATSTYAYDALDSLASLTTFDEQLNEPQSRLTITRDAAEHTVRQDIELWNADTQQFELFVYDLLDSDAAGKTELTETFFDFPGLFTFGQRSVFYYLNNSDCVSFTDDFFTQDGQSWDPLTVTYYFYGGQNVSTDAPTDAAQATAFPNPFFDEIRLTAPVGSAFEITDASGKRLASGRVSDQNQVVRLGANCPAGLYFLTVKSPGGAVVGSQKLAKF